MHPDVAQLALARDFVLSGAADPFPSDRCSHQHCHTRIACRIDCRGHSVVGGKKRVQLQVARFAGRNDRTVEHVLLHFCRSDGRERQLWLRGHGATGNGSCFVLNGFLVWRVNGVVLCWCRDVKRA